MQILEKRASGILCHITSLPSNFGIGDFGHQAYRFSEFLRKTGQSYWQILPLHPVIEERAYSPYSCASVFAGNKLLISPEIMFDNGIIDRKNLKSPPLFKKYSVDYKRVVLFKNKLFMEAYENFKQNKINNKFKEEFDEFCFKNDKNWLIDSCLFEAIKDYFKGSYHSWIFWPEEIKRRDKIEIKRLNKLLKDKILYEKFIQFIFFKQWLELKNFVNSCNIKIIGDMPLYVDFESADVWANSEIFKLDKDRKPLFVSGVPPDYFSNKGQLWNNPVYNWDVLKKEGYGWWIKRFEHNFKLFDIIRIDHFRGLVDYWEIKAGLEDATKGKWVKVDTEEFLTVLLNNFKKLPVIAEDLGIITQEVREIIKRYKIPSTKVLVFAFSDDFPKSQHLPHNYLKNCVVYTGTHDNNSVKGWFDTELKQIEKKNLSDYIGKKVTSKSVSWDVIRLAMSSIANLAIIPIQDILGLGKSSRMNNPAITTGNWKWRFTFDQLTNSKCKKLFETTRIYDRM